MSKVQMVAACAAVSGIYEIRMTESMGSATSRCVIRASKLVSSVTLNDVIQLYMGTDSYSGLAFTGLVKNIQREYPPGSVTIECEDMLVRAKDKYLVPNPTAYELTNTSGGYAAEKVVAALLQEAFLGYYNINGTTTWDFTDYITVAPNFSFAVGTDTTTPGYTAKLKSVYDACKEIGDLLNYRIWADFNGAIHFVRRPHYPDPTSPVSDYNSGLPLLPQIQTFLQFSKANANIQNAKYAMSADSLRNEIFVLGDSNLQYDGQLVAPTAPGAYHAALPRQVDTYKSLRSGTTFNYPKDFTQGAVIASTWLISNVSQSALNGLQLDKNSTNNLVKTAAYNLEKLNRINESVQIDVPGDYRIHAITCNNGSSVAVPSLAYVSDDFARLTDGTNYMPEIDSGHYGPYMIYACDTSWSEKAYRQTLTLMRGNS